MSDKKNSVVVVARYKENLKWIRDINVPHIIYNKNKDTINDKSFNIIDIPNIGTESFNYLQYIIDHYHSLPDRIIFTQADPFRHSPKFISLINDHINLFKETQPLTQYYSTGIPGNKITDISYPYTNINNIPLHIHFFDNRFNIIIKNLTFKQHKLMYSILSNFLKSDDVRCSMMRYIGIQPRSFNNLNITPMCYSAIFSVDKNKITQYNRNFYLDLYNKCISLHGKNGSQRDRRIFGWVMEYAWMELFHYDPPIELIPKNDTLTLETN